MKASLIFLIVLIFSTIISAQVYKVPESASYDSRSKRYFVSNYGDGNIIQIDSTGTRSYFKTGLSKSLGMIIHNNILYVVTGLKMIKGFSLDDASVTFEIQINEAVFLNDITTDTAGHLYVTDSNNRAVYKIDIARKRYILFVKTKLDNPNGIIYDKSSHRLVLCYFREDAQVDQITLDDSVLSTLVKPGLDNFDGIAQDEEGNFYISSWGPGSFATGFTKKGTIYKFDNSFKDKPQVFSTDHYGPADIFYAAEKNEIIVPLFLNNDVTFKTLKYRKWSDINYAGDNLIGHRLDIYLPVEGAGPYPVVVTVAGSAFFSDSSKHWAFGIGESMLEYGFAVVPSNHRSSRKAVFPAQINDIKGVLRFLRAHAMEYNLDTTFIGITGNSSGGHLSAMMGSSVGVSNFTVGNKTMNIEGDVGGNLEMSSHVDAVVDWYGPTTFQKMDSCGSTMVHDAADSPESILIGGPIQENDDLCALADPITYIDKNDPPFLIIHGDTDPFVPYCQSLFLFDALLKSGVKSELILVSGGGHGEGMWLAKYKNRMSSFFIDEKNKKMEKK